MGSNQLSKVIRLVSTRATYGKTPFGLAVRSLTPLNSCPGGAFP